MKNLKTKLILSLAFIALASACGKKSDDAGPQVSSPRDTRASGPALFPSGNGTSGSASVQLQLTGGQDAATEAVKVLMSPTLDPNEVGKVQRIEVIGNVAYGADGNATPDSAIKLTIFDEYAGKQIDGKTIQPIIVQLMDGSGSVKNPVNLTFSDNYGRIMVTGNWNGTTFTGTVSFQNNNQGINGKNSGTLGSFTINTCSFFKCGN